MVSNIINKFIIHGTIADLPGRGKTKIDERLQHRIFQMVDKQPHSSCSAHSGCISVSMNYPSTFE